MIQDTFYDSETGGVVYWVRPQAVQEPEYCSDEESSDSGDSISSNDTITSSEARDYFCEFNGRLFVDSPDVPIWLPADASQKLVIVHRLCKLLYGGNYFGPMSQMLCSPREDRPRVLDICTRDGAWVQEMAKEFPNIDFVSLDVAPMVHHTPRKNIVFEVYDIQHELLEPDGSFDFVRMFFTTELLKDIRTLVTEVQRVLKPGGLLCIIEPEFALYDTKDISRPAESTPQAQRILDAMQASLLSQGSQVNVWAHMEDWLGPGSSLWDGRDLGFLPFERIVKGVEVLHAGGWDTDSRQQGIRLLLAQIGTVWVRNLAPMLSILKMDDRDTLQLMDGAIGELRDLRTPYAFKVHHVFAYKPLPTPP